MSDLPIHILVPLPPHWDPPFSFDEVYHSPTVSDDSRIVDPAMQEYAAT